MSDFANIPVENGGTLGAWAAAHTHGRVCGMIRCQNRKARRALFRQEVWKQLSFESPRLIKTTLPLEISKCCSKPRCLARSDYVPRDFSSIFLPKPASGHRLLTPYPTTNMVPPIPEGQYPILREFLFCLSKDVVQAELWRRGACRVCGRHVNEFCESGSSRLHVAALSMIGFGDSGDVFW